MEISAGLIDCPHSHFCSGCDGITFTYADQRAQKIAKLQQILSSATQSDQTSNQVPIQFQSFGTHALRTRLDFTIDHGKLGLFSHITKQIEDLASCHQLSPELANAYQQFRNIQPPALKGSFRLRVSPIGEIGIWLDFSNEDVKSLLEDKTYLLKLQKLGFVEIGQRHKTLYTKPDGTLGVKTPEFHPWSRTRLFSKPVKLLSTVASFTQPSHISNDWITQKISDWSLTLEPKNILEFGSGIGNLSFACLTNTKTQLTALEFDSLSFEALKINATKLGVQNQIKSLKGDFRQPMDFSSVEPFDLLLLNPARNGAGDLLKNPKLMPEHVIYMSCYPESFDLDIQNLASHGYSLKEIWIVDQFPQTQHMEILSRWQKLRA